MLRLCHGCAHDNVPGRYSCAECGKRLYQDVAACLDTWRDKGAHGALVGLFRATFGDPELSPGSRYEQVVERMFDDLLRLAARLLRERPRLQLAEERLAARGIDRDDIVNEFVATRFRLDGQRSHPVARIACYEKRDRASADELDLVTHVATNLSSWLVDRLRSGGLKYGQLKKAFAELRETPHLRCDVDVARPSPGAASDAVACSRCRDLDAPLTSCPERHCDHGYCEPCWRAGSILYDCGHCAPPHADDSVGTIDEACKLFLSPEHLEVLQWRDKTPHALGPLYFLFAWRSLVTGRPPRRILEEANEMLSAINNEERNADALAIDNQTIDIEDFRVALLSHKAFRPDATDDDYKHLTRDALDQLYFNLRVVPRFSRLLAEIHRLMPSDNA